jgi:DnaJ-class molecular chaperone
MRNSKSKTHYETLEVEKDASLEDIKKAYRRLAKLHHPDVNGGSSEMFGLISEAYEILSDEGKRSRYDLQNNGANPMHPNMQNFGFNGGFNIWGFENSRTYHYQKMNPDIKTAISVHMGQAYVGFTTTISFDQHIECTECLGSGRDNTRNPCKKCQGLGRYQDIGKVEVTVPSKTMSGSRVVIPGAGNIMSDGRKGNLEISIQYVCKSEEVICSLDGTLFKDIVVPWESALLEENFQFKVFSFCQNFVSLKLDSSVVNGGQQRLKGLGMSNRDLVIKVWYSLPSKMCYKDRKRIAKAIKQCQIQKETKKETNTTRI